MRHFVRRREARQLRRENEDAHDQRRADRLKEIQLHAVIVRDLAALEADFLEDAVQLDCVEPQIVREPVDLLRAVVVEQVLGQELERAVEMRFARP